ncbi:MAG: LPS assembly lipoprotein LptE [Steroidobacteraceae bacterium]
MQTAVLRLVSTGCVALAAAVLLVGCGFHLEGRTVLPAVMHRPYIETSNQQSDFVQSLRRDLLISGARPTGDRARASAVIVVHAEVKRRVLSVSAANRPTEYEVRYTVRFSVTAGGKTLLPWQTVRARRSYTFSENLLLATEHEQSILTGAMGRELADIVMRRLATL